MKKGLIYTLLTVTFAVAQIPAIYGMAPVIRTPPDFVIGDLEVREVTDGVFMATGTFNRFVYPTDYNILDLFVSDDDQTAEQIKWSFIDASDSITINGVSTLASAGDAIEPPTNKRIRLNNTDPAEEDSDADTLTFRDEAASPVGSDPGPYADPASAVTARTLTLFASDCSTFTTKDFIVYTVDDTSDSISGGVSGVTVQDSNFAADGALGWTGGNAFGLPGTYGLNLNGLNGLCMESDFTGDFGTFWNSPEAWLELVDNNVYQCVYSMSTDQSTVDAIPFWSSIYDNLNGAFLNFGGEKFFIDVVGGAAGIGRTQGVDQFETWFAPNAVTTPQWKTAIANPANAGVLDMRVTVRDLDLNDSIVADADAGTICLERVVINRFDADQLDGTVVLNDAIDPSTHIIFNPGYSSAGAVAGSSVSAGSATLTLTPQASGGVDGIELQPAISAIAEDLVNGFTNPLKYHPVTWDADARYCIEIDMRSGATDTDPIDIITIAFATPTFEQGGSDFTTRAAPGGLLDTAASPKTALSTYRSYWYSHNVSLLDPGTLPGIDSWRWIMQVFNNGSLFPSQLTGDDDIVVEAVRVIRIENIQ
jgi:hypothetical protein